MLSFIDSVDFTSDDIKDFFNTLTAQFGKIKEHQFQGFAIQPSDEFEEVIIFHTVQIRDAGPVSLKFLCDRASKKLIALES
jgi:hypothetical protein